MRLRYADIVGALPAGGLTNVATTVTFAAPLTYAHGVPVPTLAGGDIIRLTILTPEGRLAEVVDMTAYDSGTGAATIVRAQEGTSAIAHWPGSGVTSAIYPSDVVNVLTTTGPVNVKSMGAIGDGITDDTAAIHAAIALNRGIYLPKGTYLCSDITDTTGHIVYGDGANTTVIKAKAGTGTLYSCLQMAGKLIRDVQFDGATIAATCVDTSWVIPGGGSAPSQGNRYSNVRVRRYTTIGWKARSNNDSPFDNVLIEDVSGALGLQLNASGGLVELNDCRIIAPMELACQAATINGGFYRGLRIIGGDWNVLQVNGGYWYGDPTTHSNIDIATGSRVAAASFNAIHMENGYVDGSIIGGGGALYNGIKFNGGHIFATGAGIGAAVVVEATVITDGPKARITFDQSWFTGLLITAPAALQLATINCVVDGFYKESRLGVVGTNGDSEHYIDSTGAKHYIGGVGTTTLTRKSAQTINSGVTALFSAMPRAGLIHIHGSNANGPSLLAYYTRLGAAAGVVTVLNSTPGTGGETITLTIPGANAQDTYTTSISVTHSAGSALILHAHAFGF